MKEERKADTKNEKLEKLQQLANMKESKRKALKEIGDKVIKKKEDKLKNLGDIALSLKRLVPLKTQQSHKPQYSELPPVGVSLKIYGISNVDTASMMYEVDLTVMIDWADDNMAHVEPEELKDLNYEDQFFNPCVTIENAKAGFDWLEGRDEVPRFNQGVEFGGKSTWLKKTQRFRGLLTIQEIKLQTFPFDVQELPIVIKAKKCYIPLTSDKEAHKGMGHAVTLTHNDIRKQTDSEYKIAVLEHERTGNMNAPRRADFGHWIGPAVNDQMVEFRFRKVFGVEGRESEKKDTLPRSSSGRSSTSSDLTPETDPSSVRGASYKATQGKSVTNVVTRVFPFLGFLGFLFGHFTNHSEHEKSKPKPDTYTVSIIVDRPVFSSYFFDLVVMVILVFLACTSFWDTAAPELSSRMSISLTIILTLAAYTSTRPSPIAKCPKLTFQDLYEVVSFMMVVVVSIMNTISVTMCGGEHEEAPQYMKKIWEEYSHICDKGWCESRKIDCHFMTVFVSSFIIMTLIMGYMVYKARLHLSSVVRKSEKEEREKRKEERKRRHRTSLTSKDASLGSTLSKPGSKDKVFPGSSPVKGGSPSSRSASASPSDKAPLPPPRDPHP